MGNAWETVIEGHCRCSGTRFTVSGKPLITAACHCRGCQQMTSGPYSLSSLYPAEKFAVIQGGTIIGGLCSGPQHHFCPDCLSWMFTIPEGMDDYVNVRSPLLHTEQRAPFAEFYTDQKLPGAASGAAKSFGDAPDANGFMALVQEFAETETPQTR